jgi:hypothetical protein
MERGPGRPPSGMPAATLYVKQRARRKAKLRAARAARRMEPPARTRKALLEMLCQFANWDEEQARAGDWVNARLSLDDLAEVGAAVPRMPQTINADQYDPAVRPPPTAEEAEAEVRAVIADLKTLIRGSAMTGGPMLPVRVHLSALPGCLLASGTLRDTTLLMAAHLLTGPALPPLAVCPEDDRVYIRSTAKRFCSTRCTNRAWWRAHREKLATAASPTPPPESEPVPVTSGVV